MKLYTEEQVREAYNEGIANGYENSTVKEDKFLNYLTPIELPSDEEIDKATPLDTSNSYQIGIMHGFEQGAIWMKEQILNQNK